MGRIGVDIYPLQVGVPLEDVVSFGKYLGGSPTNVAVAAARHGRRSAVITRTGDGPVRRATSTTRSRGFGVDDAFVTPVAGPADAGHVLRDLPARRLPPLLLPLPRPRRTCRSAPDELDLDAIRDADVFWVTVTGLCQEPSREAHARRAARRAGRREHTVLDLDYRPMFWADPRGGAAGRPGARARRPSPSATARSARSRSARREPHAAAAALLERGVDLAVVKQGPKGVLAATARRARRGAARSRSTS